MNQSRIFWGVVLIVIGIVFSLSNFGIVQIKDVWGILGPVIMIVFGLWVAFRPILRRPIGAVSFSIPIENEISGDVRIDFGAGRLKISAGSRPDLFIEGDCSGEVKQSIQRHERKIEAHLYPDTTDFPHFGSADNLNWALLLSPDLPLRIEIQTGASENVIDLRRVTLTNLKISSGASSTQVILPEKNQNGRTKVNAGAASMDIEIPSGVAARIHTQGALSSVSINTARFPKIQGYFQSSDYETSINRIDLEVEIGVGSLTIR